MNPLSMNRREFLTCMAAGGAAAAAPVVMPARVLGADAPSKKIALGFIGAGGRASALLGGFLGLPDCRVVAICDCFGSRRERAARRVDENYGAKGCRTIADFRELCADPAIDAVVIATPDHWHVPAALTAVCQGKHVYVEKPLGISIRHDQALREAVQGYGVVFQYGTQQRSMGHMRRVCELVVNGRIGKLQAVEVVCPGGIQGGSTAPIPVPADLDYDMYLGPAPETPYTKDRCTSSGSYHISDFALGFIAGWGAHPLDIMVWGLGDTPAAVPVEYEGSGVFPTEGLYDTAMRWDVRGRFADGKEFRFVGPGGDRTTFIGDRGRIAVSRGGIKALDPPSLKEQEIGPGEKRLHVSANHGQNFLDAIRTGGRTVSPVEAACWSDAVSHLADIAIRTGRRIKWDPSQETILDDPTAARMLYRPMRTPWSLE
ncbi:MAG: Gfo/Idh/MocA family oxidoreductase [Candidatus Sumerlaeota bacterium]|nr:Gfo/Idh/MocA family oxidoreductase [Candidatus Sumerlaeota bacterium]